MPRHRQSHRHVLNWQFWVNLFRTSKQPGQAIDIVASSGFSLLPALTEEQMNILFTYIADYQLTHGSILKIPQLQIQLESPVTISHPIGVSTFPTPFPRNIFQQASTIQPWFNELYIKVAEDPQWIHGALDHMLEHEDFVRKLWSIWERVKAEGEVQPWKCAVWRSDYMLHSVGHTETESNTAKKLLESQFKQVEFNTFSCAGGCHGDRVVDMHRYLAARGAQGSHNFRPEMLPPSSGTTKALASTLEAAHQQYGPSQDGKPTAILMTVQPCNVNIADERPIEYALAECEPPVQLYRVEFSQEIMDTCSIGPSRELLYRPPLTISPVEISVVYHRAGYDASEYDEHGVEARWMLERSRAIKCPNILSHLAGFKRLQQRLAMPGVLERFIKETVKVSTLQATFGELHPLDDSPDGVRGRTLATDPSTAADYILKPSLEGGGHNIYGRRISRFLKAVPKEQWGNYILMKTFTPPSVENVLISQLGAYTGPVISELGIFGSCLWRHSDDEGSIHIERNEQAGWSFKTKPSSVDEMSVVKGYGCFDCPYFLTEEP